MRRLFFVSLLGFTAASCGGTDDLIITPPPPPSSSSAASISVTSGDNQTATIQHVLPQNLVVTVKTRTGAPVAGVNVDWAELSGDALLTPTSPVTDANGQASASLHLGVYPGSHAVVATVKGTNLSATFAENATAPIIIHYDGSAWSTVREANVRLYSVSGVAANKALAGGLACSEASILAYDGSSWRGDCGGGPEVRSISANAPNDVFAVEWIARPMNWPSYVSHYDGQTWSIVYNHKNQAGRLPDLRAVSARAGDDVVAVGDAGNIVHFSGGVSWTIQPSGTTQNLKAVWLDKASTASFVVGDAGTILYSDGTGWRAHIGHAASSQCRVGHVRIQPLCRRR